MSDNDLGAIVTPDLDPTMAEVGWRLRQLETTVGKLDHTMAGGFGELHTRISALTFVRADVYEAHRLAMERSIEASHKLAMWALGMVASLVLGAVVTLIVAVATR